MIFPELAMEWLTLKYEDCEDCKKILKNYVHEGNLIWDFDERDKTWHIFRP